MKKISIRDVNKELKVYIEKNIYNQYDKNDEGHQSKHIIEVIERSFELSLNSLNPNIIFVTAAFHDIGVHIDRKRHEIESAKIMMNDKILKNFFTNKELIIIKHAIEDHRASSKRIPRNIYGKLVSSADRPINLDDFIKRTYNAIKKTKCLKNNGIPSKKDLNYEKIIEAIYEHIVEKFGNNGYSKIYFKDDKYKKFIREVNLIIQDKCEFYKKIKLIDLKKN